MKKKLKLKDLEVESFVTTMEEKEKVTIDGGAGSFLGICLKSFGDACVWTPIQIEQTALCIPNSYDQGACTDIICTQDPWVPNGPKGPVRIYDSIKRCAPGTIM